MPQTIRQAIGSRLRAARLTAKLTQEEVARDFQCSRQAVSSWERGATMPTVIELRELALLYVVSTDAILIGVDDMKAARNDALAEMRRERENPPALADTPV